MRMRTLAALLLAGCASGVEMARASGTGLSSDVLGELDRAFPRSVQESAGKESTLVQFCPDNTCEAFVASRGASVEELADFTFLFVYYFSEYAVLEGWRRQAAPIALAELVVKRRSGSWCAAQGGKDAARCILLEMARLREIRIEAVRYDEGARSVVPMPLP